MSWLETVTMENCLFCLICQEVSNSAELPTNSAMLSFGVSFVIRCTIHCDRTKIHIHFIQLQACEISVISPSHTCLQ